MDRLIRWFKTSTPAWFDRRVACLLLVLLFMTLAWNGGPAMPQQAVLLNRQATATLEPEVVASEDSQKTPYPQEWLDNREQTNGIVFGGVMLVLIIVGGTLHAIRKRPGDSS
ncbi:MAG: hypothetical protein VB089_02740 [Anaerolineaceae bacterium]|nr:hypothetical protein [Anaerolineaceae bacterium]